MDAESERIKRKWTGERIGNLLTTIQGESCLRESPAVQSLVELFQSERAARVEAEEYQKAEAHDSFHLCIKLEARIKQAEAEIAKWKAVVDSLVRRADTFDILYALYKDKKYRARYQWAAKAEDLRFVVFSTDDSGVLLGDYRTPSAAVEAAMELQARADEGGG